MYRRYNPNQHPQRQHQAQPSSVQKPSGGQTNPKRPPQSPQQTHRSSEPYPHTPPQQKHTPNNHTQNITPQKAPEQSIQSPSSPKAVPIQPEAKVKENSSLSSKNLLLNFIPRGFYNPDSKKILGLLTAEDLLLIALIFLFLESSDEDNPLLVLALVYVLLSDYIDLGDFAF